MSAKLYCAKCKKVTDTVSLQKVITKNNRNMLKGRCIVCNSAKTKFVAKDGINGTGIVNSFINKMPFEMHLPGHNFTGLVLN